MKKFDQLGRSLSTGQQKMIMGGDETVGDGGGGGTCCAHTNACGGGEIWCCGSSRDEAQAVAAALAYQCGQANWCCDSCVGHSSTNC